MQPLTQTPFHLLKRIEPSLFLIDKPYCEGARSNGNADRGYRPAVTQQYSQTEREFIRQRQAEGIAAAKARGVQFGRCPREKPGNYKAVLAQWQEGEITAHRAALFWGVDRKTFLKWVGQVAKEESMVQ